MDVDPTGRVRTERAFIRRAATIRASSVEPPNLRFAISSLAEKTATPATNMRANLGLQPRLATTTRAKAHSTCLGLFVGSKRGRDRGWH